MANITKKFSAPEAQASESASPLTLIDRFFDDSLLETFNALSPRIFGRRPGMAGSFPKVDISETDDAIKIVANVPGVDPKDINIDIGEDYISLSGRVSKEQESKDAKGRVYKYEREYGEFRREFSLPARVSKQNISAKAKNGVLTLVLPKIEEEKKTRVPVEIEK